MCAKKDDLAGSTCTCMPGLLNESIKALDTLLMKASVVMLESTSDKFATGDLRDSVLVPAKMADSGREGRSNAEREASWLVMSMVP